MLSNLHTENNEIMSLLELDNKIAKILGLLSCLENEVFKYKIKEIGFDKNFTTKRDILSHIATLFDPLGLVGSVDIKPEILFKKCSNLNSTRTSP